ncbi:glycosyltransferase family 25 protein [Bowmanella denitrificans]|uniref:glycosyltransferase family 25 protein n=1 Tax=Bowmanella denitrificans TaxID=366582 RepID=UPI0011AF69EB|nr:glycosyltransferase family 25 protein [Bowmanella denitrificans]
MKRYQIFLINLDRSTIRLQHCLQQFAKFNIQFDRIPAIDGQYLSEQELQQHYDVSLNSKKYHKRMNRGEIACFLSHRQAWQRVISEGLDFALILEDDFILEDDLHKITQAISAMDMEWDYIKLAEYPIKRRARFSTKVEQFTLSSYDKVPSRTCAQLVSLSGAKKLLVGTEKFGRPVDVELQYWWEHKLNIYGLTPYIIKPHDAESEIDIFNKRKKSKSKSLIKFKNLLSFAVKNRIELRRSIKFGLARQR